MKHTTLMMSSTVLLALAAGITALRLAPPQATAKQGIALPAMGRYERAVDALLAGQTEQVLASLAPDPEEVLLLPDSLAEPDQKCDIRAAERHPVGTLLFLGQLLAQKSRQAAAQGDLELAQALLDRCLELSRRLRTGSASETATERARRQGVAARIERLAERAAQAG